MQQLRSLAPEESPRTISRRTLRDALQLMRSERQADEMIWSHQHETPYPFLRLQGTQCTTAQEADDTVKGCCVADVMPTWMLWKAPSFLSVRSSLRLPV